jgi:hypothetical protein
MSLTVIRFPIRVNANNGNWHLNFQKAAAKQD